MRQQRYNLDVSELKPYFSLESVCAAAFDCANRLFGLRFVPRPDIKVYHLDVQVRFRRLVVPARARARAHVV